MTIHTINGVLIRLNDDWKNIAISVSGGADSALLAYILCDIITKKNMETTVHIINHIRCWKTKPWQQYDALNVINYLIDKFPKIKFKQHKNFIAPELEYGNQGPILTDEYNKLVSGDNAEQRGFAEYVCHQENCEAYYNAVTHNPRDVDLGGMKERDVEQDETNVHLERIEMHIGRWALHPFRFTEKSWVLSQYRLYGILDLFNLTRSCEGVFPDLDYKTYTPGQEVPVCGECFWCKERKWAIEQSK